MAEAVSVGKDPRFVESGRRAARARWGEQRIVRIAELDPRVRAAVLALVAADAAARNVKAAAVDEDSATAPTGGRRVRVDNPAA